MRVASVEHGKAAPLRAGAMQPLEFTGDPLRFLFVRCVRYDADFFAIFADSRQWILGNIIRFFVVANGLARNAQDSSG